MDNNKPDAWWVGYFSEALRQIATGHVADPVHWAGLQLVEYDEAMQRREVTS